MPPTSDSDGAQAVAIVEGSAGLTALADDQRASHRLPKGVPMRLTGLGSLMAHECTAMNLSEGGVYVRLPADSGLCVGQRCELSFLAHAEMRALAGEKRYATVVRTEPVREAPTTDVGAGLRFDQPLFL